MSDETNSDIVRCPNCRQIGYDLAHDETATLYECANGNCCVYQFYSKER